jgi:hypothetical protein
METLNIEQLGVLEMDALEISETDGGFWGLAVLALCIYAYDNRDRFMEGFNAAYN